MCSSEMNDRAEWSVTLAGQHADIILKQFPDLTCCICQNVLLDPVLTPCNHLFCRLCLEKALLLQPRCPLDRKCLFPDELRSVEESIPWFHRLLFQPLQVNCPMYAEQGCAWVGPYPSMQQHLNMTCLYVPFECSHCHTVTRREFLPQHQPQVCRFVPDTTKGCGQMVAACELFFHRRFSCTKRWVDCPLKMLCQCVHRFIFSEQSGHFEEFGMAHSRLLLDVPEHQTFFQKEDADRLLSMAWLEHKDCGVRQFVQWFINRHALYFAGRLAARWHLLLLAKPLDWTTVVAETTFLKTVKRDLNADLWELFEREYRKRLSNRLWTKEVPTRAKISARLVTTTTTTTTPNAHMEARIIRGHLHSLWEPHTRWQLDHIMRDVSNSKRIMRMAFAEKLHVNNNNNNSDGDGDNACRVTPRLLSASTSASASAPSPASVSPLLFLPQHREEVGFDVTLCTHNGSWLGSGFFSKNIADILPSAELKQKCTHYESWCRSYYLSSFFKDFVSFASASSSSSSSSYKSPPASVSTSTSVSSSSAPVSVFSDLNIHSSPPRQRRIEIQLEWSLCDGSAEVEILFGPQRQQKQCFLVSPLQMLVLTLFDYHKNVILSLQDMLTLLKMKDSVVFRRHLLSLVHPSVGILQKRPNSSVLDLKHVFRLRSIYPVDPSGELRQVFQFCLLRCTSYVQKWTIRRSENNAATQPSNNVRSRQS